jgi:hypothetical protein
MVVEVRWRQRRLLILRLSRFLVRRLDGGRPLEVVIFRPSPSEVGPKWMSVVDPRMALVVLAMGV